MRYRVIKVDASKDLFNFGTYFKTKKEAVAYASALVGFKVQRKLVNEWIDC